MQDFSRKSTMDERVTSAIVHLETTLLQCSFGLSDYLDFTAGLVANSPPVAFSFTNHAGDFCRESPSATLIHVFCEAYRRTFLDKETAAKYGAEEAACVPPDEAAAHIRNMCEHMLAYLRAPDKENYLRLFEAGQDGASTH